MVFSYPIRLLSILLCILISISSIASSRDSFSSKNGNDFPLKEKDLFYAIKCFDWYRLSNSSIRITDRYDFSLNDNAWDTIQEYAVLCIWPNNWVC